MNLWIYRLVDKTGPTDLLQKMYRSAASTPGAEVRTQRRSQREVAQASITVTETSGGRGSLHIAK